MVYCLCSQQLQVLVWKNRLKIRDIGRQVRKIGYLNFLVMVIVRLVVKLVGKGKCWVWLSVKLCCLVKEVIMVGFGKLICCGVLRLCQFFLNILCFSVLYVGIEKQNRLLGLSRWVVRLNVVCRLVICLIIKFMVMILKCVCFLCSKLLRLLCIGILSLEVKFYVCMGLCLKLVIFSCLFLQFLRNQLLLQLKLSRCLCVCLVWMGKQELVIKRCLNQ